MNRKSKISIGYRSLPSSVILPERTERRSAALLTTNNCLVASFAQLLKGFIQLLVGLHNCCIVCANAKQLLRSTQGLRTIIQLSVDPMVMHHPVEEGYK